MVNGKENNTVCTFLKVILPLIQKIVCCGADVVTALGIFLESGLHTPKKN